MDEENVRLVQSRSVRIDEDRNQTYTDPDASDGPVYTVEDAVNYIGFGPFQILVTIFAGMIWVRYINTMYCINTVHRLLMLWKSCYSQYCLQ